MQMNTLYIPEGSDIAGFWSGLLLRENITPAERNVYNSGGRVERKLFRAARLVATIYLSNSSVFLLHNTELYQVERKRRTPVQDLLLSTCIPADLTTILWQELSSELVREKQSLELELVQTLTTASGDLLEAGVIALQLALPNPRTDIVIQTIMQRLMLREQTPQVNRIVEGLVFALARLKK
mgnify:CR=1 FL=1